MKKRGRFLSVVIVLVYLFLLLSVIAVLTNPDLAFFGPPYWINSFNFLLVVLVRTISLLYIWKMYKWGVYVYFASHIWIFVYALITIALGYSVFGGLVKSLVVNIVLLAPVVWAIARKWKVFK